MVLVPLKDKVKLYTYFLKEGVFACKKDNTTKNANVDIPNLYCFLIMRSLVSRKMATEIFSWQWHYYFLTKQGVEYLREYLGVPANIVPNTYKLDEQEEQPKEEGGEEKKKKKGERRERGERGERRGRGRPRGGRGGRRGGRRGNEEGGEQPETKEEPAE